MICGDHCAVLRTFPDECIDLTITSPPYDTLRDYQGYQFNFQKLAQQLWRITRIGGVVVWIIGDATVDGSETGESFRQVLYFKSLGFNLHDTMIYEKSGFANPSRNRYHQIFEYMFVLSKGTPKTFNPIKDKPNRTEFNFSKKRRKKDGTISHQNDTSRIEVEPYGMRFNIWRYVTGRGNSTHDAVAFNHPALFPEKLVEDHLQSWSNPGDLILDPMNGAGSTTKMAYLINRVFIGIDISPEYCQIAMDRLKIARAIKLKENPALDPTSDQFMFQYTSFPDQGDLHDH